jgi:type VI secretion system protein ImpD
MPLADLIAASEAFETQTEQQERNNTLKQFLGEKNLKSAFSLWVKHFSDDDQSLSLPVRQWISRQIALIDELINDQLNAIIHHPQYQQLEASWLSLQKLSDLVSDYPGIKLRLLNVSWQEVTKDISRAQDFDQSQLFQRIYTDEFGMPGGNPFGLLIGDYEVSHRPFNGHPYNDIETLQGLSQIAAASFAPFICSATPQLFGLDHFETLGSHINIDAIFQQDEYIKWRAFRASEDARFIGLTLPKVLLRQAYDKHSGAFTFHEQTAGSDNYLWGNAAFAFASVVIREFGNIGWFAQTRGTPRDQLGGGLLTEYQAQAIAATNNHEHHIITEVLITDSVERELNDAGLMALCQCYGLPFAAFHSNPSLHKAKIFQEKSATANARVGAMLQQILCASRFAHYLKVMIRDKVGSFTTDLECERFLQSWLNEYTTGMDDLNWEMRARYPLRDARVQVKERAGSPGVFTSVIYLKPHYIAEHLVSELKLTTELTQSNIGTGN